MNSLTIFSILAGILIGQPSRYDTSYNSISRNSFNMIDDDHGNRLADGSELRGAVIKKARDIIKEYKNNDPDIRSWLSRRKLTDWIYTLPEISDGLSKIEKDELASIVNKEMFTIVISELKSQQEKIDVEIKKKKKPRVENSKITTNVKTNKYWFWAIHNSNRVLLYGWSDPTTGQMLYNLDEQLPEVKAVLQPQRGWP